MEMVSWEEVLLNDKIRTDDAEMRAELEVRKKCRNRFFGSLLQIRDDCADFSIFSYAGSPFVCALRTN
jgi:hypothetical protein